MAKAVFFLMGALTIIAIWLGPSVTRGFWTSNPPETVENWEPRYRQWKNGVEVDPL